MRFSNVWVPLFLIVEVGCSWRDGASPQKESAQARQFATGQPLLPALTDGGVIDSAIRMRFPVSGRDGGVNSSSVPIRFPVLLTDGEVNPTATAGRAGPTIGVAISAAEAASLFLNTTLTELVGRRAPGDLGFQSHAEVQSARFGVALPVFRVGRDDLQRYVPEPSGKSILVDRQEMLYPIFVNGEIRAAVVAERLPSGRWQVGQFRRGVIVNQVETARLAVSTRPGAANLVLVEIPALSEKLLGHDENGVFMLTPVHDVAGTALRAGETHISSDVWTAIQPRAVASANADP